MRRKLTRLLGVSFLVLCATCGAVYGWYTHRPQPKNLKEEIFRGVTYERVSYNSPRPMVAHIVTVNLNEAKPKFFTTPPEPGQAMPYNALPVSSFLKKHRLQLAINADFFKPYWSRGPWDYYPHQGDPVYARGLSMHQGEVLTPAYPTRPSLFFTKEGRPTFEPKRGEAYDAISGESVFMREGEWAIKDPDKSYWRTSVQPRNAVGVSKDGQSLVIVVVDGRQPGYSEGSTVRELAAIAASHGAGTMLDLDGGGSETLVREGKDGKPELLNCPIDNWIPNRERPVANQLGIWLQNVPSSEGRALRKAH